MKKNKILGVLTVIFLSSCSIFTIEKNNFDCQEIDHEIELKKSLFKKLSKKELNKRSKIEVPTVSSLDKLSVFSEIVNAIKNAKANQEFIAVDLRGYKKVDLGNIVIANSSPTLLHQYLRTSKFSQGFFALININSKSIDIYPPEVNKIFKKEKIKRGDLEDLEIIINVSNSEYIDGNMKFSSGQKFSLIADNILKPYRLDLREASNMQFNLNKKWIMNLYSIENNKLEGGKITTGLFKYINNKNSKILIHKFDNSFAYCYKDINGQKF
jgi:hypothetical protein